MLRSLPLRSRRGELSDNPTGERLQCGRCGADHLHRVPIEATSQRGELFSIKYAEQPPRGTSRASHSRKEGSEAPRQRAIRRTRKQAQAFPLKRQRVRCGASGDTRRSKSAATVTEKNTGSERYGGGGCTIFPICTS